MGSGSQRRWGVVFLWKGREKGKGVGGAGVGTDTASQYACVFVKTTLWQTLAAGLKGGWEAPTFPDFTEQKIKKIQSIPLNPPPPPEKENEQLSLNPNLSD